MSIRDRVIQEVGGLSDAELGRVAEFLAFLKFRARLSAAPDVDETWLASLYAEFCEEDRALADEGISDYAAGLHKQDTL